MWSSSLHCKTQMRGDSTWKPPGLEHKGSDPPKPRREGKTNCDAKFSGSSLVKIWKYS